MKFIFTCGGTAGHINPAIAIAGRLREMLPDSEILFIGSGRELENRLIPMAGYDIKNIKISGFERSFTPRAIFENICAAAELVTSDFQMRRILREFRPVCAIGTGGYVCYPVLKRIAKCGIPTLIHESNAIPGLTTKLLSTVVDKVLVAFPDVSKYYREPERVVLTGTPVRSGFTELTKTEARARLGLDGRPLVVSFWGSLGADKMNDIMADFISENIKKQRFNHIHAAGSDSSGVAGMLEKLRQRNINDEKLPSTDLRAYIDDMPTVMSAADIVLCRAGASTLGELEIMGKPAVLIPSPYVTNDHQRKNARQLENAGGAVVMEESECSGEKLFSLVDGLLSDRRRLERMSESLKAIAVPDADRVIVDMMISMLK